MYIIKSEIVRNELTNILRYCENYKDDPAFLSLVKASIKKCMQSESFLQNTSDFRDAVHDRILKMREINNDKNNDKI